MSNLVTCRGHDLLYLFDEFLRRRKQFIGEVGKGPMWPEGHVNLRGLCFGNQIRVGMGAANAARNTSSRAGGTPGGMKYGRPYSTAEKMKRKIWRCCVGADVVEHRRHLGAVGQGASSACSSSLIWLSRNKAACVVLSDVIAVADALDLAALKVRRLHPRCRDNPQPAGISLEHALERDRYETQDDPAPAPPTINSCSNRSRGV